MRKFLFLLLLIPFGASAQETKKWEIGLNTAIHFITKYKDVNYDRPLMTYSGSVSAYRNFNHLQAGLLVESWMNDGRMEHRYSPQAVINYKIDFRKVYAYGGGAVGYVRETSKSLFGSSNGFLAGIQAGGVYNIGKHFGINLETGVRFKHTYHTVTITDYNHPEGQIYTKIMGFTDTYFPVSLGVRYRF